MEEKDRKLFRMLGVLSTVGITLVVSTVIGYFIGHYLDGRFNTTPWLT
ncbi:MAG: AtpZ/AtpI family protein, partial [Nitrospirae bacterium]|nr:AtpZ/AtpI family protein [Nitrospirota bacterium]